MTTSASDKLHADLREPMEEFLPRLARVFGEQLDSVTLYGATVTDRIDLGRQSIRSAIIVKRIDLDQLRELAAEGTQLGRWSIAAPLILTPHMLDTSRDTFPLELLEVQVEHLTVLGTDPFEALAFDASNVRLQCERELRVLQIGLHQGLLASRGSTRRLGAVSLELSLNLLRILRGLLWLNGYDQPCSDFELLAKVEQLLDRKLPGLHASLDDSDSAGWIKFQQLYADVQALGQFADAL